MRTSLNEIKIIEDYLLKNNATPDALLFECKLMLNNELCYKTQLQRQAYAIIKLYGQKELRKEIEAVENQLFIQPRFRKFRNAVASIFSNKSR